MKKLPTVPKKRTGIIRLFYALTYSIDGFKAGLNESALRLEYSLAIILIPLAFWLGNSWLEKSILATSILLILLTELLNTAIEKTLDRFGNEWNQLSKIAKDMASAAVLISCLIALIFWLPAIFFYFYD